MRSTNQAQKQREYLGQILTPKAAKQACADAHLIGAFFLFVECLI
jgi:hypothetical protein